MIKLVYCICRRPDLTPKAFARYWRDVHGPIGARIPGLRRLVQSLAVPVQGDRRASDFDGVAELWFDDVAALLAARKSPEWQASTADETNFVDPSRFVYLISEEWEVELPRTETAR